MPEITAVEKNQYKYTPVKLQLITLNIVNNLNTSPVLMLLLSSRKIFEINVYH